eukprot:TRINITY_DN8768_c0_g1_i4.p1 TRINITY_DN8768_c0_g1~~TRINITY_DN8768_c0_g1_i4.p1  ORF type:complete len:255 (+),score=32.51 TRINITY_DN8768_c0_g1_i4:221-985(+)
MKFYNEQLDSNDPVEAAKFKGWIERRKNQQALRRKIRAPPSAVNPSHLPPQKEINPSHLPPQKEIQEPQPLADHHEISAPAIPPVKADSHELSSSTHHLVGEHSPAVRGFGPLCAEALTAYQLMPEHAARSRLERQEAEMWAATGARGAEAAAVARMTDPALGSVVPLHFNESQRGWYTVNRTAPKRAPIRDGPQFSGQTIVETRFARGNLYMMRRPVATGASKHTPHRRSQPPPSSYLNRGFCAELNSFQSAR